MKPNQEKILLEDLIAYYTPEAVASYRNDAQYLAGELKDIHTLTLLGQTQFSDIVVVKVSIARMLKRNHWIMIKLLGTVTDHQGSWPLWLSN